MAFFLKLRHWELCLMLFLPTILCLLFGIPLGPLVVAAIGLFLLLVLFAWLFSIGVWSNRKLPATQRRRPMPFALGLAVPILYLLLYIFLYIPLLEAGPPSKPPIWLLPLHLLSMVGIFYGIWFAACQFKSLQASRQADFLIFSSMFFLLFIFPLGIWIIQPEVNQLYRQIEQSPGDADAH